MGARERRRAEGQGSRGAGTRRNRGEERRAGTASIQPKHQAIAWAERLSIAIEARLDRMGISSRGDS